MLDWLCSFPWEYSYTAGWIGFIFGVTKFIYYLLEVYATSGILKSISMSYYAVEPHWRFKEFMWYSIASIGLIGQNYLYMIVCALFTLMTVNPTINRGNVYYIPHMIGAIGAITLASLGIGLCFGLWWVVIAEAISLIITALINKIKDTGHTVYWIEVVAISYMIIGMFLGRVIA